MSASVGGQSVDGRNKSRVDKAPRPSNRIPLADHNTNINHNKRKSLRVNKTIIFPFGTDSVASSSMKPQAMFQPKRNNVSNFFSGNCAKRVPLTTNKPRQVEVVDPSTNKRLRIFSSCSEAARQTGICRTKISRTCRKGGKLIDGQVFRYMMMTDVTLSHTKRFSSVPLKNKIYLDDEGKSDISTKQFTSLEYDVADTLTKIRNKCLSSSPDYLNESGDKIDR